MYAYSNMGEMDKIANIANFGKEYGFDLMLSEPLPPLGNGKQADFLFMLQGKYDEKSVYEMSLRIRFPNPHDGIVEFMTLERDGMREPNMYGSELLSDYQAPEGGYISEVLRTTKKSIGEKTAFRDDDFRRNYYFRVRSEVDESGRITKANYGKIYGDFHFFAANKDWGYLATLALVTTYYNPNNNDRNVEFDPKRNLLPSGNVQRP